MERHSRDEYLIVGEGTFSGEQLTPEPSRRAQGRATAAARSAGAAAVVTGFRFSRIGPRGRAVGTPIRRRLASAMATDTGPGRIGSGPGSSGPLGSGVPAGFTYLGQFIDHDLTFDPSPLSPGTVLVSELEQLRSPSLDLDSLYGLGPTATPRFYRSGGLRLKTGKTKLISGERPPPGVANTFDLPRVDGDKLAVIPDHRNDENLAVGQTHLAFIKFHNRVVDLLEADGVPRDQLFGRARRRVTRHYQWMIKTDFLPQIVRPSIVEAVFRHGRKVFEVGATGSNPTMPVEFSVACYRLGHSMVRAAYDWNRVFDDGSGSLDFLFSFSGTSGGLGNGVRLPSNWIADFRRLYDFSVTGRSDLVPIVGGRNKQNFARRIDTLLAEPLASLPDGAIGGPDPVALHRNLAFRNLDRARMLRLATGQQMVTLLNDRGVPVNPLTRRQILVGNGGVDLGSLTSVQKDRLVERTPLWFYILREAEVNNGELVGVGGRIVAETFHRAMEGSRISIVNDPAWRPTLGPDSDTFRMVDLLLVAFEGRADLLNPLGDP